MLQKKRDYEGSLSVYRRVLEKERKSLTAQLGAAKNLVLLRRFSEAKDILERAVTEYPETAQLRFQLARLHARLGERDEAAEQTRVFRQLQAKQSTTGGERMPSTRQEVTQTPP